MGFEVGLVLYVLMVVWYFTNWKSLKKAFENYFNDMATDEETKRVMRAREENRRVEAQKRINKMHNDRIRAEKTAKVGKTASVEDILGFNV